MLFEILIILAIIVGMIFIIKGSAEYFSQKLHDASSLPDRIERMDRHTEQLVSYYEAEKRCAQALLDNLDNYTGENADEYRLKFIEDIQRADDEINRLWKENEEKVLKLLK